MRCALSIGLLWISLLLAGAEAPTSRLPRVELTGIDYVRIDSWADANDYNGQWVVPRREYRVSNPSGDIVFNVDSRKISIRGVSIWLSHVIAIRDGHPLVSSRDLATAIHPILFPQRNASSRKIRSIVLDPGHGGKDPGNQEGKRKEKEFTLTLAREVKDLLVKAGFSVTLTRDRDTFIELPSRPEIANRRGADLFVSLHFNSADGVGGSTVKGSEVYCMTPVRASSTNARGEGAGAGAYPGNRYDPKNVLLAYQIQKALANGGGMEDRGVKRARFAVLRDATMPAVLIESAFMTNPGDARAIYDPAQRKRLAQAIVDGIQSYRRLAEQPRS